MVRSKHERWIAFYSATWPKLWGIETDDPSAIKAGLEQIVAPCMPEHAAKTIVQAWNEKNAAPAVSILGEQG